MFAGLALHRGLLPSTGVGGAAGVSLTVGAAFFSLHGSLFPSESLAFGLRSATFTHYALAFHGCWLGVRGALGALGGCAVLGTDRVGAQGAGMTSNFAQANSVFSVGAGLLGKLQFGARGGPLSRVYGFAMPEFRAPLARGSYSFHEANGTVTTIYRAASVNFDATLGVGIDFF
jgi:hypothetical protein